MTKRKYSQSPPPPNNSSHQNNNSTNQSSGFFGNMFQGMALGTGSSIGHKMIDGVFSDKKECKIQEKKLEQSDIFECNYDSDIYINNFHNCMKDNILSNCKELFDLYIKCSEKNKKNQMS